MNQPAPKPGDTFTHPHKKDLTWVPQPGERWSTHAPNAVMRVTRVTRTTIWYGYATDPTDTPGGFRCDRNEYATLTNT